MKYTYLLSNFVPIGLALIFIWRNSTDLLRKSLPVLLILGLLGLINALGENPALRWGIWNYNGPHTLGIRIWGVLFETYIYCFTVPIVIGSAAIKFADLVNKKDARR